MAIETLITFFGASLLLAMVPGPDNIFVLMQSVMMGKKSGLLVVLGLCTGLLVHTSLVAIGVAVIFQNSSWAFNTLKALGVGYLLYLAWQAFKAGKDTLSGNNGRALSAGQLYLRGIVMNITNPKVAIFFLAFLPQFAQPQLNLAWQMCLLGSVFIFATFLVFSLIALMAGNLANALKSSSNIQLFLHKAAGLVFLILALKLVFTSM